MQHLSLELHYSFVGGFYSKNKRTFVIDLLPKLRTLIRLGLSIFHKLISLLALVSLSLTGHDALSQDKGRVVQLSGIVVGEDSISGVPGVHIYVPKAGRGTTSNVYGYFSLPVLQGDSVVVSAVSYRKRNFIVPRDRDTESFTLVIELESDTTYLPAIEIFPWPTEELFKEAIVALELPDQRRYDAMNETLSPEVLAQMYWDLPMDGSMNHRYFVDQQFAASANRFMYPSLSLLNPAAWAQLIRSIKKGDFKKDR